MNCPNCNNPLEEIDAGDEEDIFLWDDDLKAYKCPQCGKRVYII